MSETTTETMKNRSGGILVAFAAGALAGAAMAFLLAPRSGRETRELIGKAAKGTRDVAARVPAAVRDARHAFSTAVNGARDRAGDASRIPLDASGA
jgi:gas vesicle protein